MPETEDLLRVILEMVSKAPVSQLSETYRAEAQKLLEAPILNRDKILNLFQSIYDEIDGGASSFVKELVNPKYTHRY